MDISSISSGIMQMNTGNIRQTLTTSMIKMKADQQNQMAEMLAQNTLQASQNISQPVTGSRLSLYA